MEWQEGNCKNDESKAIVCVRVLWPDQGRHSTHQFLVPNRLSRKLTFMTTIISSHDSSINIEYSYSCNVGKSSCSPEKATSTGNIVPLHSLRRPWKATLQARGFQSVVGRVTQLIWLGGKGEGGESVTWRPLPDEGGRTFEKEVCFSQYYGHKNWACSLLMPGRLGLTGKMSGMKKLVKILLHRRRGRSNIAFFLKLLLRNSSPFFRFRILARIIETFVQAFMRFFEGQGFFGK